MSKDQQKSQRGQAAPNYTESEARAYFESRRWPNGDGLGLALKR